MFLVQFLFGRIFVVVIHARAYFYSISSSLIFSGFVTIKIMLLLHVCVLQREKFDPGWSVQLYHMYLDK